MNPTQQFWNERYAAAEYLYGTEPNEWFRLQLARLAPGRILLPAEGEGRNAVHAAGRGWEVTALDLSDQGRDKALQLAAQEGTSIRYDIADIRAYPLETAGSWDAIGLFYAHFPPDFRAETHRRLAQALRTGAHLILEAFHPEQLGRSSGGPRSPDMLYTLELLLDDFAGLTVLEAEKASIILNEGPGHTGPAEVVRLLLQKP
ncbi:MAG: class I SAM-dependent methyltransferase [Saprospiraceae bacterium]|nr:class I SAM-dependent methyltransferase [Saprospiraceae bacterium]